MCLAGQNSGTMRVVGVGERIIDAALLGIDSPRGIDKRATVWALDEIETPGRATAGLRLGNYLVGGAFVTEQTATFLTGITPTDYSAALRLALAVGLTYLIPKASGYFVAKLRDGQQQKRLDDIEHAQMPGSIGASISFPVEAVGMPLIS